MKNNLKKTLLASCLMTLMGNAAAAEIDLFYDETEFADERGQQALAGFQEAADFWSNLFIDDVTINLGISFADLNPGVIGSTRSNSDVYIYQNVAVAMINDATSVFDQSAVNSLPCVNSEVYGACAFSFLDQENPDNPDGYDQNNPEPDGVSVSNVSLDNVVMDVNQAVAKALGLGVGFNGWSPLDGEVQFSSAFAFDFDRTDGIDADKMDFVGVAIHEIGHALGFVSGVDTYDIVYNSGFIDPNTDLDSYAVAGPLDLFRFSETSLSYGAGVRDFTPGGDHFFSIDGGQTSLAELSSGRYGGDGQQASHFKDNQGIGIMDPTFAFGEFGDVTIYDAVAFDVIGWDLNLTQVPAPGTLTMFGLALGGLLLGRRRIKR